MALRLRPSQLTSRLRPISTSTTAIRSFIPRTQQRRIAFRHPHAQQHAASYQPVHFQQPSLFSKTQASRKRRMGIVITFVITVAALRFVFSIVSIDIEYTDDIKDKKEGSDSKPQSQSSETDDDFDEEECTFIPLTWGKQLPREFYKGSDPEWQEFVKIAKDKSRHKKIQDALVAQVFTGSKKHPHIAAHLGQNLKVGKYWLDITFPDGPPQEYERWGLEIGETQINWAPDRVTAEEQFRLKRALYPIAVMKATWAASKAVGGIQYRRIKQWLGVEDIDPFSPEERLRLALEMAEKQQNAKNQKGRRGGGDIDPAGAVISRSTPTEDRPSAAGSDETKKRFPWQMALPMPSFDSSGGQSMDLPIFQLVFQTQLQKHWMPKKMEPPRGTFVVQGMMEIRGSKGQILFDVQGCYDPKQAKYVMVQAHKRNFKMWNQRPKGGP